MFDPETGYALAMFCALLLFVATVELAVARTNRVLEEDRVMREVQLQLDAYLIKHGRHPHG